MSLKEETKAKHAVKPATRWRNRWRVLTDASQCASCGSVIWPGQEHNECCTRPYPSRDLAETAAECAIEYQLKNAGCVLDEYLGAFPVEEGA